MTEKMRECKHHGYTEYIKRGKSWWRCKKCRWEYVNKRRKELALKLHALRGSKCEICGYNKCSAALEWHHLDPSEKEYSIGSGTRSFERMKEETEKCILVCANCHRELHMGSGSTIGA